MQYIHNLTTPLHLHVSTTKAQNGFSSRGGHMMPYLRYEFTNFACSMDRMNYFYQIIKYITKKKYYLWDAELYYPPALNIFLASTNWLANLHSRWNQYTCNLQSIKHTITGMLPSNIGEPLSLQIISFCFVRKIPSSLEATINIKLIAFSHN